jgi:hypothetical protein
VQDGEEIVRVVVDLGALALGQDVLHVQRVPPETFGEHGGPLRVGSVEVDPGQPVVGELSRLADSRNDLGESAAGTSTPDAGQAGHGY